MILLANENFPRPSIVYLRQCGYDVLSVREKFAGFSDLQIVEMAKLENFVILTMDKDYGDIVFRGKYPNPPEIVFFRFAQNVPPDLAGKRFVSVMSDNPIISRRLTVITEHKIRHHDYDKI